MTSHDPNLQNEYNLIRTITIGVPSKDLESEHVRGINFTQHTYPITTQDLHTTFKTTGIQATNLAHVIDIINQMITAGCDIYLGYSSNMISCGLRELILYLCQNKFIKAIVTTTGGIEEDFLKTFYPMHLGDFKEEGSQMFKDGLNRIGNMIVPNKSYDSFTEFTEPILLDIHNKQEIDKKFVTPSELIDQFGCGIKDETSVYYWCNKNAIPVFCPALTDGSVGDMLVLHAYQKPGLVVDVVRDVLKLNRMVLKSKSVGVISFGAGICKHHLLNAAKRRGGADYCVVVTTGSEYDGSDGGANEASAFQWGYVKSLNCTRFLRSEASLVVPLIVAETFKRNENVLWERQSRA